MRLGSCMAIVIMTLFALPLIVTDSYGGGGGGGAARKPKASGLILEIQGDADMKEANEKPVKLERGKHILHPLADGDKVRVNDKGKLSIYSFRDGKVYELRTNTIVEVQGSRFVPSRGDVDVKQGYVLGTIGPMSIPETFGEYSSPGKQCISAVSPKNTYIDTLTPTLRWANACVGTKKVTVKIISDKAVVYQAETGEDSFKVPDNLLKHEKTYTWLVDGGPNGVVGDSFTVLSMEKLVDTLQKRSSYGQSSEDLSDKIPFIMYLLDNKLYDEARSEISALQQKLPDNPYFGKPDETENAEKGETEK